MAGGAFLRLVVFRSLRRVARAAERARRRQLRNGRGGVARVASLVRDLERRMSGFWVGELVAARAGTSLGVMLVVTVLALGDRRRRGERDRSSVALDALPIGMARMQK